MPVLQVTSYLFYFFSAVLVLSSFCAVSAKRSVHSVLFLVLAFFAAAWVFLSQGAEFLAMMLIIIYVGAIAVLFLFVVMMLEEPNAEVKTFKRGKINFLFSFGIGTVLFIELFVIMMTTKISAEAFTVVENFSIKDIGRLLYTEYFFEFQSVCLLFFVAMVGAIVLTMFPVKEEERTKRQNFFKQVARSKEETLVLTKPKVNEGVEI